MVTFALHISTPQHLNTTPQHHTSTSQLIYILYKLPELCLQRLGLLGVACDDENVGGSHGELLPHAHDVEDGVLRVIGMERVAEAQAVLAEGDAAERHDIIFLQTLPLFFK